MAVTCMLEPNLPPSPRSLITRVPAIHTLSFSSVCICVLCVCVCVNQCLKPAGHQLCQLKQADLKAPCQPVSAESVEAHTHTH